MVLKQNAVETSKKEEDMQDLRVSKMIMCDVSKLLSRGSCSSTFTGTLNGRLVAVEKIKSSYADHSLKPTLIQLDHPNVVKLLQIEEDANFM